MASAPPSKKASAAVRGIRFPMPETGGTHVEASAIGGSGARTEDSRSLLRSGDIRLHILKREAQFPPDFIRRELPCFRKAVNGVLADIEHVRNVFCGQSFLLELHSLPFYSRFSIV